MLWFRSVGKYGKIGCNITYDFNVSDFFVSMQILMTFLTKSLENNDTKLPRGKLEIPHWGGHVWRESH